MKLSDNIDMKGRLRMELRNRSGSLVDRLAVDNSIVTSGRDLVAKLFINEPIDPISHLAVGTGATAVDAEDDTELDSELFRKPINPVVPVTDVTTTLDGKKKVRISADLDFNEGNGALTEAGLFNAGTNGVMYNRVVFPAVNKTTDFKLTLIWEITF